MAMACASSRLPVSLATGTWRLSSLPLWLPGMYLMQPFCMVVGSTASENVAVSVLGVMVVGGQYLQDNEV